MGLYWFRARVQASYSKPRTFVGLVKRPNKKLIAKFVKNVVAKIKNSAEVIIASVKSAFSDKGTTAGFGLVFA
jgi:hypothetical protein